MGHLRTIDLRWLHLRSMAVSGWLANKLTASAAHVNDGVATACPLNASLAHLVKLLPFSIDLHLSSRKDLDLEQLSDECIYAISA